MYKNANGMIKKQIKLYERWITFVKMVFDPWVVLLTIFLALLLDFSVGSESGTLKLIFTILVALVSGLLGAILIKKWVDLTDEKLMIVRGKLAIRSLKLLFFNLLQTEKRTKKYIERLNEKELNYNLINCNFEEIIERCKLLEEECVNSIENWSDLIEEANVKTKLIFINNLKSELERLENILITLKKFFAEDPDMNEERRDEVKEQMAQTEFEIREIKAKLLEKENEINSSILSGMTGSCISSDSVYAIYKSCPSCGRFYSGSNICPFCSEPFTKIQIN